MSALAHVPSSPDGEKWEKKRSHAVTDLDLHNLGVRGVALELALYARRQAHFTRSLAPAIPNERVAKALGVNVRTIQRAKAKLEAVGIVSLERKSRYVGPRGSENRSDVYLLDRRRIEALWPARRKLKLATESHPGVTEMAPPKMVLKHPPSATASPTLPKVGGRARARPDPGLAAVSPLPVSAMEQQHDLEPWLRAARDSGGEAGRTPPPSAAGCEPLLERMRLWVAAAGRGAALTGLAQRDVFERCELFMVRDGASVFDVKRCRLILELELGAGQMSLVDAVDERDASLDDERETSLADEGDGEGG